MHSSATATAASGRVPVVSSYKISCHTFQLVTGKQLKGVSGQRGMRVDPTDHGRPSRPGRLGRPVQPLLVGQASLVENQNIFQLLLLLLSVL